MTQYRSTDYVMCIIRFNSEVDIRENDRKTTPSNT